VCVCVFKESGRPYLSQLGPHLDHLVLLVAPVPVARAEVAGLHAWGGMHGETNVYMHMGMCCKQHEIFRMSSTSQSHVPTSTLLVRTSAREENRLKGVGREEWARTGGCARQVTSSWSDLDTPPTPTPFPTPCQPCWCGTSGFSAFRAGPAARSRSAPPFAPAAVAPRGTYSACMRWARLQGQGARVSCLSTLFM